MKRGLDSLILTFVVAFLLPFSFLASPFSAYAKRGCCSWHGGVCGCDTSVGRQICCDGTYSPSCVCAYIPPKTTRKPPQPKFPAETQAKLSFFANEDGTWNIEMEVLDTSPTKYSAVISKCAGCDPGPLVDFYSNKFNFQNVQPGRWYVNVKKEISGQWSNVVYWTIDVPEWRPPTPTISYTNISDSPNDSDNTRGQSSNNSGPFLGLLVALLGAKSVYYLIKKNLSQ